MNATCRNLGAPALILLACAGCATRSYRAYEGEPLPPDRVAAIEVGPAIDVLEIEGGSRIGARPYMPGHTELIELPPGTNTLVVRYSTIYGTERDDHQAFYSKSVPLTFAARAGTRYRLAHEPVPEDPVGARVSRTVDIWLEDPAGNRVPTVPKPVAPPVAAGTPAGTAEPAAEPAEPAAAAGSGAAPAMQAPGEAGLEALNLLKFWWDRAGADERRAFLDWIEP